MLGGNYIGQAYLAQGYAGSTVTNGTGALSGSFSASATGSAYLPASGSLTASFSASATGTAFLPSTGAVTATFSASATGVVVAIELELHDLDLHQCLPMHPSTRPR